jgi:DNA-binding MurR/RpiR family transcriptional regulator
MNEKYSAMSKGQKLLSAYISDNYDHAVFLTAARLGEEVGVSESTVVRFASFLGYKGFPQFQRAMEEVVRDRLDAAAPSDGSGGRILQSDILKTVLQSDAGRIERTMECIDENAFDIAVTSILKAKTIYIIGMRSCAPLADYLAFYLNYFTPYVKQLRSNSSSEVFEQMMHIGAGDVIIGISFPRYSMLTLKALEYANDRNAKVITLTDSVHSPMNLYSSCNLIALTGSGSFVDALASPMSVIHALLEAVSRKKKAKVSEALECMDKVFDSYSVTGSDEIDYIEDSLKFKYRLPGEKNE